ncbi:MAG: carboxymuconolactone decarboxylase family protein [Luteimonas sp.]
MTTRICPVTIGQSPDTAIDSILQFSKAGFGDTQMFGVLGRRPELLKRIAALFGYFLGGEGGLLEPSLLEMVRLRGAHLNACTYCATVRLLPVQADVKPKEHAVGVTDISGMTKAEALTHVAPIQLMELTPREAIAVQLVDKLVTDPHAVDDEFYDQLRAHFSEEEVIELVVASSLFTLAGAFNTVVRLDTDSGGIYPGALGYATAAAARPVLA